MIEIKVADLYYLKLDSEDSNKVEDMQFKLVIDDNYVKHFYTEDGVELRKILGLENSIIAFRDGNDLNWTRENLIVTPKPTPKTSTKKGK
jgi:hypothetical protein